MSIPDSIQAKVLTTSRRRCCICFALDGDSTRKKGQLSHLDGDPSNNRIDNLVFLCLNHHDEYDSRTSQTKGLRRFEVQKYRSELYIQITLELDRRTARDNIFQPPPDREHRVTATTQEPNVLCQCSSTHIEIKCLNELNRFERSRVKALVESFNVELCNPPSCCRVRAAIVTIVGNLCDITGDITALKGLDAPREHVHDWRVRYGEELLELIEASSTILDQRKGRVPSIVSHPSSQPIGARPALLVVDALASRYLELLNSPQVGNRRITSYFYPGPLVQLRRRIGLAVPFEFPGHLVRQGYSICSQVAIWHFWSRFKLPFCIPTTQRVQEIVEGIPNADMSEALLRLQDRFADFIVYCFGCGRSFESYSIYQIGNLLEYFLVSDCSPNERRIHLLDALLRMLSVAELGLHVPFENEVVSDLERRNFAAHVLHTWLRQVLARPRYSTLDLGEELSGIARQATYMRDDPLEIVWRQWRTALLKEYDVDSMSEWREYSGDEEKINRILEGGAVTIDHSGELVRLMGRLGHDAFWLAADHEEAMNERYANANLALNKTILLASGGYT